MKGLVLNAEWDPRPNYTITDSERTTRKAITGSSVWRRPRVAIETVPDPKLGPREGLIRPRACGVCGSDEHFYETDKEGAMLYPDLTPVPVGIGHEFSGAVTDVGKDERDLRRGGMVTSEQMN